MHLQRSYYSEPVYRPPNEAGNLLIQVTEGCTYKCNFYISNIKQFKIRKTAEIKRDLETALGVY